MAVMLRKKLSIYRVWSVYSHCEYNSQRFGVGGAKEKHHLATVVSYIMHYVMVTV